LTNKARFSSLFSGFLFSFFLFSGFLFSFFLFRFFYFSGFWGLRRTPSAKRRRYATQLTSFGHFALRACVWRARRALRALVARHCFASLALRGLIYSFVYRQGMACLYVWSGAERRARAMEADAPP
jgi:hypothetical protein